jgi:hypothetical protein
MIVDPKAAREAMEREKEQVIRDKRRKRRPIFYRLSRLRLRRKCVAEIKDEYRTSILRRKRNHLKMLQEGGTHTM